MDIKKVLGGFWRFTREIRSLRNDKQLMAHISDGRASFLSVPGLTTELPDRGSWMLFREAGDLVNHQFADASGPVHRQYWHCVSGDLSSQGRVYFAEANNAGDITSKDPLQKCDVSQLTSNFKVANFFHNISFVPVQELDAEIFAKDHPQYAKEACVKFIKENGQQKYVTLCEHLCGNDYYSGVFSVESDDRFSTYWHICGPQKAYSIATYYDKSSSD